MPHSVIGWLQVSPKCDFDRVSQAMNKANKIAYLATSKPDAPELASARTGHRAFTLEHYRFGSVHRDEESSAPIFNYARFFPWVHAVEQVAEAYHMASENALANKPVNGSKDWIVGQMGRVAKPNRKGILEDVERYCRVGPDGQRVGEPDEDAEIRECANAIVREMSSVVVIPIGSVSSRSSYQESNKGMERQRKISRWGSDVWTRVVVASALALFLQWGTTGAAIIVVVSRLSFIWVTNLVLTASVSNHSGSHRRWALVGALSP